jgi:L-malate glycosyltransferase
MSIGGTELNAVRTADLLLKLGLPLKVVCLGGPGPLTSRYESMGVVPEYCFLPNLYGGHALRSASRLVAMMRRSRVDIVHCHDLYSNMFAAPLGRVAGASVVTSRRWLAGPDSRTKRLANRMAYRISQAVVANSPRIARHLLEEERLPSGKVHVVENFIEREAAIAPPMSWIEEQKRLLGLPTDRVIVGLVGSMRPVKNHRLLLEASARLLASSPEFHIVFVGADYGCQADLELLATARGLSKRVHFVGVRPSRPLPQHLFDITVLTSHSEGFPNAILEGMAAGNPVVSTSVGGVPDVVVHNETGFLVSPGDVQEFADALRRLIQDRQLRRQFGEAGRRRASGHFSSETAIDKLSRLYFSLSASHRS